MICVQIAYELIFHLRPAGLVNLPQLVIGTGIGADEHIAGRSRGPAVCRAVGRTVGGQRQAHIRARHDAEVVGINRQDQPFLRLGINVAVNLHVVPVLYPSVDIQHACFAAYLRTQDVPVACRGLFQLEVLRDGTVSFVLCYVVVIRVRTAADVQIQTASGILEGIDRSR